MSDPANFGIYIITTMLYMVLIEHKKNFTAQMRNALVVGRFVLWGLPFIVQ